ncbi:hypothetical protein CK503_05100 [Aliifodinibius salipaludis]|uniref:DUF2975 domain-containing protein n=1 Tax=Fodinibius salipaludis TaxID=2032627 RepID=A0A2A2GBA7_9BACT|nr:hypothetical protein [Aliifodinibius salipaludis]PAU94851.1 hypothetical protein CK503_05100 [Aliifodinibius salipaludis]
MYTKNYRIVVLSLLSVFTLWMGYLGFNHYRAVSNMLDAQTITASNTGERSLKIGNLRITKTTIQDVERPERPTYGKTYISVTNLNKQTPLPQLDNTLLNLTDRQQQRTIYGLQGSPSFLVLEDDLTFWRSQFCLQIFFYYGGLFIIGILYMLYYEINYRRDNKLFVPAIKNVILSLSLLFSGGAILKWGLDFRLISFLNNQFYLGEPSPPIDNELILLGVALLFTGIILQRAVALQKEQDLTI